MGLFSRKPRFVDAIIIEYRLMVSAETMKMSERDTSTDPAVIAKTAHENVIALSFPDHRFILYVDKFSDELAIILDPAGQRRVIDQVVVPYEVYQAIISFVTAKKELKARKEAIQRLLNRL